MECGEAPPVLITGFRDVCDKQSSDQNCARSEVLNPNQPRPEQANASLPGNGKSRAFRRLHRRRMERSKFRGGRCMGSLPDGKVQEEAMSNAATGRGRCKVRMIKKAPSRFISGDSGRIHPA
jgi:hypothetical protein